MSETIVEEIEKSKKYTESRVAILRNRIESIDPSVVGDMVQISSLAATYITVLDEPGISDETKMSAYLALTWAVRRAGL